MSMNDLRENPIPPAEQGSTPKIVAALIVALGFGAMGAYTYETGTWNSQPKQVAASQQLPSPEPLASAAPSEALPQSAADLPPPPVKNIPAQTSPQATAAPPVKIARAQIPAPALPQSAQASPEVSAPAANIPEQPVPQVSTISPPVNTPPQEAPAQNAPEQPAEAAPAQ